MEKRFKIMFIIIAMMVIMPVIYTFRINQFKSEPKIILLYSTLGYELNATKRALLRTEEPIDPNVLDTKQSIWRLLNSDGGEVMTGLPLYLEVTFGIQLWEIDFSDLRTPGFYRICVELRNREGAEIGTLSTLPFEVRSRLYFTRTFINVSINNAEARKAPSQEGGGYYDCNSKMGEAYSHGIFLAGLVNAYVRRNQDLSPEDQARLIEAANRAVDYLMLLHDDSTGEIAHEHPSRPGQELNLGIHNTREGLFGLVVYLDFFKEVDPSRAKQAFNKALKSSEYLEKIGGFLPELKVSVYYHLFKYSGNETFKNLAISSLNHQLITFDLRKMYRDTGRSIPYFEGLYYCVKEFKDYPNYSLWIQRAKMINEQYFQHILKRNGFYIIPQGGEREWDDMKHVPPGLHPPHNFYANTQFATMAIDAIFLAEVTGDHSLEKIASSALGWITGLNPGIPGEMVTNPPTNQSLASAAFIMNLDACHVKTWSRWWWAPTKSMMSIVNGFVIRNGKWSYIDDWPSAETFIRHDGAYLYAICIYEDYLNTFG